MHDTEILSEFRAMTQRIAPELDHLYIFEQPDDAWPMPTGAEAYCVSRPTAAMRDFLISQSLWTGFAPCVVFANGLDESNETKGVFVHELSHALPAPPAAPDVELNALARVVESQQFSRMANQPVPPSAPPWTNHEDGFIRRALHLWYRAVNQGWIISPRQLGIAGDHYGLSDVNSYLAALGNEPDERRFCTFKVIESIPQPAAFSQLFIEDLRHWNAKQRGVA